MNFVDISVVKTITKAHKLENGLWEKTVLTDSYGVEEELTITGTKEYVNKYKRGYTWAG